MGADSRPLLPTLPFFFVLQTSLACLVALSPRWPGRLAGSIVLFSLFSAAYRCTAGDAQRDYSIGNLIMIQAFIALVLLWLADPVNEFRHERDSTAPAKLSFPRRVFWALCIINSPRGIGWTYEVANTPPRPSVPRWTFVVQMLLRACRWYLFLDATQAYQRANMLWSKRGMDPWLHASGGIITFPINIIARFSNLVGLMALEYALFAAVFVALGLSLPRDWPDLYGRWSDSYTVRRFWGRTYHQFLRRLTASCGKACCRALGLRPGTRASSYTQLYVGFAVSGILHCGGDLMVSPSMFGTSFPFFIAQAVAITFEDMVIGAVRRSGVKFPEPLAHMIGYVWAITWLCISAPLYVNWNLLVSLALPSASTGIASAISAAWVGSSVAK